MNAQKSIRRHLLIGVVVDRAARRRHRRLGRDQRIRRRGDRARARSSSIPTSKKVQHPTGGVVAELHVRDGDQVKAGDVVIRLDDTQTRANLQIVAKGLDELWRARAREEAELEGDAEHHVPQRICCARKDDPDVGRMIRGETQAVRDAAQLARRPEGAAGRARRPVARRRSRGLTAQVASKEKQIEWIQQELEGVRDLWAKKLVQFNRVTSLEREQARLDGERGQLIASIAQAKGKISETEDPDPADRSGHAHRGRQGPRRNPRQDRRAGREACRRRGSAQAHRHPRAAERHGASARRSHRRRRRVGRAADHADRARRRQADRRGESAAAGHRSGADRSGGRDALLQLQLAHDAGGQRRGIRGLGRRHAGPAHRASATTPSASRFRRPNSRVWASTSCMPGMPVEVFIQTTVRTVVSYLRSSVPGSDREGVPRKMSLLTAARGAPWSFRSSDFAVTHGYSFVLHLDGARSVAPI